MAGFKNVPGKGYGNPFVDSLVWGEKIWDMSTGPILMYLGGSFSDMTKSDAEYNAAVQVHGVLDGGSLDSWLYRSSWSDSEVDDLNAALDVYSSVANVQVAAADTLQEANVIWWNSILSPLSVTGLTEAPGTDNTSHQRWGVFNKFHKVFNETDFGGLGFATILHEVGHSLGLAHPHDGGEEDDATVFPGVTGKNDSGDKGLNQEIYTVMSYNYGYDLVPPDDDYEYGNQGGLGAFDIAAVQALYGANMTTATGNDIYKLPTKNARGTGWSAIWDAGGVDTISGERSLAGVTIDLRAASLQQGDAYAGGHISEQNGIAGGFTIAHGVVIENAIGSAFDDILIGNSAANVLNGGAGNDIYYVDSPNDIVIDSAGVDTVYATFDFSNASIENIFVNGVRKTTTGGGGTILNGFAIFKGGAKADLLVGTDGKDKLYGSTGKDVLTGKAGSDIFIFNTKPGKANMDKVTDFTPVDDTIWLDNNYMKKLGKGTEPMPGKLNKAFFITGSKAKDANDYVIYNKSSGLLYYDEDGSGSGKAVEIASLSKKLKMTAADFMVI